MTFETLKSSTEAVDQSLNADYDFEEFDLLLDQVKDRVARQLLEKTNDITARENQRLENERMKQEIFDVRVNRLKEFGYSLVDDKFVSNEFGVTFLKSNVLNHDSNLFEMELNDLKNLRIQAEQAKRDAELKKQKDEQFEVRKNRLAEIGFLFVPMQGFNHREFTINLDSELIYNADVLNFEQRLKNARLLVEDNIRQKEANKLAKEQADKKADAEKKKADAENKARVKRLAKDKAIYENVLRENLKMLPIVFDSKEKEILDFSAMCSNRIATLLNELLTELNEL
jgi:hypothetical protein